MGGPAGCQRGHHRIGSRAAAGTPDRQHPRHRGDALVQRDGRDTAHRAVPVGQEHRCRRRRDPGSDQCRGAESAQGHAAAARLLEGQPVRLVGDHARAHLRGARSQRRLRFRGHDRGRADLAGARRRAGDGQRRRAWRGAHPRGSGPDRGDARFAGTDTRGSARCDAQPAEGAGEPGRPVLEHRRQRPTVQGAGIPRNRRCLAQRRTRAAARCRRGDRRRDQRAAGWLVQQRAGRRHSGVQAAECQHRGDGRCREGICCRSSNIGCRRRSRCTSSSTAQR